MNTDEMKPDTEKTLSIEEVSFDKSSTNGNNKPSKSRRKIVGWIIVVSVLLVLIGLTAVIIDLKNKDEKPREIEMPKVIPPMNITNSDHWESQTLFDAFSILVPNTVERRDEKSPFVSQLIERGIPIQEKAIVFNQKGLNDMLPEAKSQYCRIMLTYYEEERGDFFLRDEVVPFGREDDQVIEEMITNENTGPNGVKADLIGTYNREWVCINNANAILVTYKRTGYDDSGPVKCKILIFQDDNRLVKMILSYREKESFLWGNDFEQVMRSFKWID